MSDRNIRYIKMKQTLAIYLIICSLQTFGQIKNGKELPVGSPFPERPLGVVMDNKGNADLAYKGMERFSDFKGKLVILDFWASNCSSCISGFKELSALQEKFGDKIQIFLVNAFESSQKIKEWLDRANKKRSRGNIVPENLPIIADAKDLLELFPMRGEIGYQAWIDASGIVRLRGISENAHEKKISKLLAGKRIEFVRDNALIYNQKYAFFLHRPPISGGTPLYSSSFGLFDDKHASAYGSGTENRIDSITGTKRNTFLNFSILDLFLRSLEFQSLNQKNIVYGDKFRIEMDDTIAITLDKKIVGRRITDEDFRRKVCYEQVVPWFITDTVARAFMLKDLNRYLGQYFGIHGQWENRIVPCLKIRYSHDIKRVKSKFTHPTLKNPYQGGMMAYDYKGYVATDLFKEYFNIIKSSARFRIDKIILSDIAPNTNIDLMLPSPYTFNNFSEMEQTLKAKGFTLVPGSIDLKLFVIKKVKR